MLQADVIHGADIVEGLVYDSVLFYGYPTEPFAVIVNNEVLEDTEWTYDVTTLVLNITISAPLGMTLLVQLAD